jgi:putative flippase GtrA
MATHAFADRRFRFVLVGGWNTVFGYAAFTLLTLGLHHRLHYVVVLVIGHLLGVSQGFFLHRRIVYRVRGNVCRDFLRFQLMYAGALGANAALLVAFVSAGVPVLIAQGLIVLTLPVATYFGHLHFSFRRTAHA